MEVNKHSAVSGVGRDLEQSQPTGRVIRAGIVGTAVEYYDFAIYGYMATFIATLFLVNDDPTAALLATFATFAVAFFLRIPGGIFFGHIGDRCGRKTALSWTILLMALATAAVGLLPTYQTLGVWATASLVLCRCLQGFAAGGEIGGATAFLAESAPNNRRGLHTSMATLGAYVGSLGASLLALVVTSVFTGDQVLDWAWRLPFLVSLPLGLVGLWIRTQLEDTPQFLEMRKHDVVKKVPLRDLLATSLGGVLKIALLCPLFTAGFYVVSVYATSYLQTAGGHSPRFAFVSSSISLVVAMVVLPTSAYLSDLFGRKPLFFASAGAAIVLAFPMFMLMSTGSAAQAILGQAVLFSLIAAACAASWVTAAELLSASTRYSGMALGNNLTNTLLGGTAPFICAWLVEATGQALAPAGFLVALALCTLITTFFIEETSGTALRVD